ncbi:hypothetical protein Tco_0495624, partial [Tanacetum coccineum]
VYYITKYMESALVYWHVEVYPPRIGPTSSPLHAMKSQSQIQSSAAVNLGV